MSILLVEDNKRISEFIIKGLTESGYNVYLCEDGMSAKESIENEVWDLILLDVMLPDTDGITLLEFVRSKKMTIPVLIISALGELDDKVKGLQSGADDYLPKPFHFKELLARVQALLRRSKMQFESASQVLQYGDLLMDITKHQVSIGNKEVKLTLLEFNLLKLFMENTDRVLSRTEILNSVWGYNYDTNTNVVDVYVSFLRSKLKIESATLPFIETVKGVGYLMRS